MVNGHEGKDCRYHNGTNVENQVSLGAGETLLGKQRFEQWFYDLAVAEVRHYHSDNGIFTVIIEGRARAFQEWMHRTRMHEQI